MDNFKKALAQLAYIELTLDDGAKVYLSVAEYCDPRWDEIVARSKVRIVGSRP
jgi:hypothetical protein